jgi:hypothetical protein
MSPHRLRAPSIDGGLLAEPPLGQAAAVLSSNAERLAGWNHDFQGRRAGHLRPMIRKQVLDASRAYLSRAGLDVPPLSPSETERLVVTGHQPELFHPGVWVKNFAVASVAKQAKGWGLNLVVDNDLPKATSIRVPRVVDGDLKVERVAFDEWVGEAPYEDLTVSDEAVFESFDTRVRQTLGGLVADPILDTFWPRAKSYRALTDRIGLRFAMARRGLEAAWGVHNFEVPLSTVCETEGFLWFASHLLAHLPRFQQIHNDALNRYRALYKIRSRHHPVPALGTQDEWREAPFWAWKRGDRRRRPLLVRQLARTMQLRIGGDDEVLLEIPLGPDREACCAVETLMSLPSRGVRLRTRALTTTMFSRYLLGDLFIHGIGGAKYDELGDEISRRFFDLEPPPYLTVSMTLWLGMVDDPAGRDQLAKIDRGLRDLTYNPDRNIPGLSARDTETGRWIEAKQRAVAGPVDTHAQRLARFHEIRRCNEALQGVVNQDRARLAAERQRIVAGVHRNDLAHSREFSFVLHSERRLREAMGRAMQGWAIDGHDKPLSVGQL